MAPPAGGAQASGLGGEPQEDQALMREHALHPPRRRGFVATIDSDHDEPVFPDRSREREVDGPNPLWVADPTCIAILGGSVCLAVIMDAWSRRIVGYAPADGSIPGSPSRCSRRRSRTATRLRPSLRQRLAIRRPSLKGPARRTRPGRLDGPARQPLRHRHDGEFHEDTEGRGRLPHGLRERGGRRGAPAALLRQLQRETPTLGPRIPEPQPLRGKAVPQTGQNRRMKLSDPKGPLQ